MTAPLPDRRAAPRPAPSPAAVRRAGKPGADQLARVRMEAIPTMLVVGASTGGPQALVALFAELALVLPALRVCVTLHMPSELMPIVARHVAERCGVVVEIVRTTMVLSKGTVYFSPGDMHFGFERAGGDIVIIAKSAPPDHSCGPAIDVMFAAAASCFGSGTLAVVLSGMGKDGLAGSHLVTKAGGSVMVQDQESSAVWGMPGSVAAAGLASAILNPGALGREVVRRVAMAGLAP